MFGLFVWMGGWQVGQEKRVTFWDLREHNPVTHRALSNKGDDEAKAMSVSTWVKDKTYQREGEEG